MAGAVKDDLIPALKLVPDVLRNVGENANGTWDYMQQGLASFVAKSGEALGVFAEGTADTNAEIRGQIQETSEAQKKAAAEQLERDKQAVEEARVKLNVTEKIAATEAKLAAEEALAATKEITSLEDVAKLRADMAKELEREERAAAGNSAKKAELLKQIEALARREKEIPKEIAAAKKAALAEEDKDRREAEKRAYDAINAAGKAQQEFDNDRTQKVLDLAEKKRQQLLKAIADARGDRGGNMIDEARQSIGDDKTLKKIQETRGDEAVQKLKEGRTNFNIEDGKASDENLVERRRHQKRLDDEEARVRKSAGAEAYRDARGGKVSNQEVRGAQDDIIRGQLKTAEKAGKLAGETTDAVGELLSVSSQQQASLDAMQTQISQFRAAAAGLNRQATRGKNAAVQGSLRG